MILKPNNNKISNFQQGISNNEGNTEINAEEINKKVSIKQKKVAIALLFPWKLDISCWKLDIQIKTEKLSLNFMRLPCPTPHTNSPIILFRTIIQKKCFFVQLFFTITLYNIINKIMCYSATIITRFKKYNFLVYYKRQP